MPAQIALVRPSWTRVQFVGELGDYAEIVFAEEVQDVTLVGEAQGSAQVFVEAGARLPDKGKVGLIK